MSERLTHPDDPKDCIFCIDDRTVGTGPNGIGPERIVGEYPSWWLVLQPQATREKTKLAAGFLVVRRAIALASELTPQELGELVTVAPDAAATLCAAAGTTYEGEHAFGFNQGSKAGQSVAHTHCHVLPVSQEDPVELTERSGIISAYAALRASRVPEEQL